MTSMNTMSRILLVLLLAATATACGEKQTESGAHAEAAGHEDGGHEEDGHEEAEAGHEEGAAATTIPAKTAETSGIKVAAAGPGFIADEHEVQGLLTPVEGRVAKVMARFPGPIRTLRANIGDRVRAGQPLAVIESNLSLTTYTVPSPISGVVLQRSTSVGAVAGGTIPHVYPLTGRCRSLAGSITTPPAIIHHFQIPYHFVGVLV